MTVAQQKQLDEVKAEVLKKMAAYKHTFASPDGKIVLADLKAHFDRSCTVKKSGIVDMPSSVAYSGARDVYLHIIENIQIGETHDQVD